MKRTARRELAPQRPSSTVDDDAACRARGCDGRCVEASGGKTNARAAVSEPGNEQKLDARFHVPLFLGKGRRAVRRGGPAASLGHLQTLSDGNASLGRPGGVSFPSRAGPAPPPFVPVRRRTPARRRSLVRPLTRDTLLASTPLRPCTRRRRAA